MARERWRVTWEETHRRTVEVEASSAYMAERNAIEHRLGEPISGERFGTKVLGVEKVASYRNVVRVARKGGGDG